MKKINKILGGLALAAMVGGVLIPQGVKAETLTEDGTSSKDASIASINESDVYDITLNWSSLQYSYSKTGESHYDWVPYTNGYYESHYIELINSGTKQVSAEMSFAPAINGVSAVYEMYNFKLGEGTCQKILHSNPTFTGDGTHWLWNNNKGTSQPHEVNSDKRYELYTDSSCSTAVAAGTEYNESADYYYIEHTRTKINSLNGNNLYLNGRTVTSSPTTANVKYSPSYAEIVIGLNGGSLEDVKTAFNTENKKIGTFTITLSSVNNG